MTNITDLDHRISAAIRRAITSPAGSAAKEAARWDIAELSARRRTLIEPAAVRRSRENQHLRARSPRR